MSDPPAAPRGRAKRAAFGAVLAVLSASAALLAGEAFLRVLWPTATV
jgi:hypothetical protein